MREGVEGQGCKREKAGRMYIFPERSLAPSEFLTKAEVTLCPQDSKGFSGEADWGFSRTRLSLDLFMIMEEGLPGQVLKT